MGAKPKRKNRIAILTGGGDVPGLNPCIKTIGAQKSELMSDMPSLNFSEDPLSTMTLTPKELKKSLNKEAYSII